MPAKSKPKNSPKPTAQKAVRKASPRATFTQEEKPPTVETPPIIETPALPVVVPEAVGTKEGPPNIPEPVPVATPVENLEQILDSDTKDSVSDAKNHMVFAFGIIATVAIIVGAIVVFVIYLGSSKMSQEADHPTKVTPTASPTPTFVRSAVTFEVINSSGVTGAATKAKDVLTQIGYTVLSVGNGKKQATSSLLLASTLPAIDVSEILADTKSLFSISSSSGVLTGTTASARIVIGAK